MKRQIIFRGKRVDNGEWIYGFIWRKLDPTKRENTFMDKVFMQTGVNIDQWYEVIPDTVGQFTGLKDKNGKDIFHKDLCKVFIKTGGISEIKEGYMYGIVEWVKNKFTISPFRYEGEITGVFGAGKIYGFLEDEFSDLANTEVIGNVYDNPDLL